MTVSDEPVSWTRMEEGTAEDYERLGQLYEAHTRGMLIENLFSMLQMLRGPTLGYQVDRYEHSLQSASRALRNDERADLVVGALFHDIGDVFAPDNHSQAAAALLAPYVDEETHWVVKHHGLFQGYYYFHHFGDDRNARERYADSPHYQACVDFCANWDQASFDPDYDTLPLEHFEPLVRALFAKEPRPLF